VAGADEVQADSARGDGHMEGVPPLDAQAAYSDEVGHPVRQDPRDASSWRGVGHGAQDRVRLPDGQEPALHQGLEVHAALEPEKPDGRWPSEPDAITENQQAPDHGLHPQGGVRAAHGLRARRMGSAFLRELARLAHVAAPQGSHLHA